MVILLAADMWHIVEPSIDVVPSADPDTNRVSGNLEPKSRKLLRSSIMGQPGILAGMYQYLFK